MHHYRRQRVDIPWSFSMIELNAVHSLIYKFSFEVQNMQTVICITSIFFAVQNGFWRYDRIDVWTFKLQQKLSSLCPPLSLLLLDLQAFLDFAILLAREGGQLILEGSKARYASQGTVFWKAGNPADLVTETDKMIEEVVKKRLKERFPQHKWVRGKGRGGRCCLWRVFFLLENVCIYQHEGGVVF